MRWVGLAMHEDEEMAGEGWVGLCCVSTGGVCVGWVLIGEGSR
jgi:hypothetical protein